MANSAKGPLWLAKVESEVLRTPTLQGAIEDKCATCHTLYTTAFDESGTVVAGYDPFPE